MKKPMKKLLLTLLLLTTSWVSAQSVRIQIPYAPGYYGDTHARSLSEYMAKHGIEATVMNSVAGGGNLALDNVVNDHHSKIITQAGAGFLSFYVNNRNPYGAIQLKFFYPVGWNQWVIYGRPGMKFTGTKSFARTSYASSGVGSSTHLFFAKISADLDADMIHLPYKGSAAAAVDVAAGRVDFMIDTTQALDRLVGLGLQPLFILADERSVIHPNLPTAKQAGVTSLLNMYDYGNLYYVMNANFDSGLRDKIVLLIQEHNLQFSPVEYEKKFGVKRPVRLTAEQVDVKVKKHAQHVMELQKQLFK
jgi:tripartite-type tricarboxylate transporter receptor subunit TctC